MHTKGRSINMTTSTLTSDDPTDEVNEMYRVWHERRPDLYPDRPGDMDSERARHVFARGGTLIDLGGGLSMLNGVLAELGMVVWVFDIFEYDIGWLEGSDVADTGDDRRADLERAGVKLINCDLVDLDLGDHFVEGSVESIGSFHCLEHLHHSPVTMLRSAIRVLAPGGTLTLEVPNAINLLKRVDVLRGRSNYIDGWTFFDAERYTGHVREYDVADLKGLAERLGIEEYRIWGENWYGTLYARLPKLAARVLDRALRSRPGLCGSLFLQFGKPSS